LCKNMDKLGSDSKFRQRIAEWQPRHMVETISMNNSVIAGFRQIWAKEVTAVGVIDPNGVLVGSLSASDIKSTHFRNSSEMAKELYQPVHQFIRTAATPENFECVKTDDTLQTVVEVLSAKKGHRLFVVDAEKKPTGVVSLCDVIQQVLV